METKNPILSHLSFKFPFDTPVPTTERQDRIASAIRRLRKVITSCPEQTKGLVYVVSPDGIQINLGANEDRDWMSSINIARRIAMIFALDGLKLDEFVLAPLSVVSPQHYEELNKPQKQNETNNSQLDSSTQK